MSKQYIEVYAHFDALGNVLPVAFWWNKKRYEIDRILDVRRAASITAGGLGIRYTCRILNKERQLFFDDFEGKWFVDARDKNKYIKEKANKYSLLLPQPRNS